MSPISKSTVEPHHNLPPGAGPIMDRVPGSSSRMNLPPIERKCFGFDEDPPYLKGRYVRLALISHRRHMEKLDPAESDTLIVSADWMLWQEALHAGRHCVHYEGPYENPDPNHLMSDQFLRANDWMYFDGRDITLFDGVSLGRKFVRAVSSALLERDRLWRALEALTRRFGPDEIVFFDYRNEYGILDPARRLALVTEFARCHGLRVIDRSDVLENGHPDLPRKPVDRPAQDRADTSWTARLASIAGVVFEAVMDGVSRASLVWPGGRRRALMLNSGIIAVPLMKSFDNRKLVPIFLAKWFPGKRDLRFLAGTLAKGVVFAAARRPKLDRHDRAAIRQIERELEKAWQAPASGDETETRHYVRKHILGSGRVEEMAREVKWAAQLLRKYKPDVVFTDGLQNPVTNIFLELAKQRGIATAATWHGPFLQDVKLEIFGGDPRVEPLVDRCFTWGKNHENWLGATASRVATVRTGNLAAASYRDTEAATGARQRVLILQYTPTPNDVMARQSAEYEFFVRVVRMLRELGYAEVRLKLHPGFPRTRYYRKFADFFGLDCEVYQTGQIREHVKWADIVIGPVQSGSMLEVLASGRPFFPILLPGNSMNTGYLSGLSVYSDIHTLRHALESGERGDFEQFLENCTALSEFPDPAGRLWEVI